MRRILGGETMIRIYWVENNYLKKYQNLFNGKMKDPRIEHGCAGMSLNEEDLHIFKIKYV